MKNTTETVLEYHQRTKHHLQRYAAGPGELDWKNQPDPFRNFSGSPLLELPLLVDSSSPRYADLYHPELIVTQALTLPALAAMFELAFGISAWKQYDDTRWALRCNPSSGNLHPTEAYVVVEGCSGIDDGVHHYVSRDHVLEQRCCFEPSSRDNQRLLPPGSLLVGLSSIHWREAWKYGERAFRYCQHDVGHAIAALRYAAATLGWQVQLLTAWGDEQIGAVLGLDREVDFCEAEHEHPDVMLLVTAGSSGTEFDVSKLVHAAQSGQWQGQANVLAGHHLYAWPVIDEVADACKKPETQPSAWQPSPLPEPADIACHLSATEIIKQRRSAQSFDGETPITASTFYRMLDMTLPRSAVPPWDAVDWAPRLHLLLFVHRVEGLAPGLYLFLRNEAIETTLRATLPQEFEWVRAEECPAHLQLFRLVAADTRNAARTLSCRQEIASDGAFSLGMLAEFDVSLAQGPWLYRHLFWEAGILGQALYLEAEAAGVRGTGIGCYFDDGVHDLLGLKGHALQSMYHFTLGGALPDTRLQTLPGYAHLERPGITLHTGSKKQVP